MNEKDKKHIFWSKVLPILRALVFNKKVIWISIALIIAGVVVTFVFVTRYETRKDEIQKLYVDAFYKYKEVSNQTDSINMERAGAAISALEKVIATGYRFPEYYMANYEIGNIYLSLNKLDAAKKYFKEVVIMDRDFFVRGKAMINLARISQNEGKYEEAISYYEQVIQDYQNFYRDIAYYLKALCHEKLNQVDLAISSYKMINEDSSYAYLAKKSIDVIEKLKRLN